jgi:transcriptional regulator with XRE-family HTH domain
MGTSLVWTVVVLLDLRPSLGLRWAFRQTITGGEMSAGERSTPRTRELGATLRKHREAAGHAGTLIAERLGCVGSQISRVESGDRTLNDFDLATYLGLCDVTREDLDNVFALAHESDAGYRIQQHGDRLPDELRTLVFLETTARHLENYEPMVIPGLAQTVDYARALFNVSQRIRTPEAIDAHVEARMRRQKMLNRPDAPWLNLFVHEHALRSMVGSPKIMHEQMICLLLLTADERFTINVVTADAGPFGAFGSPFMLMRYTRHQPVISVEHRTTSLFLERDADIDEYEFVLDELVKVSLEGEESREFLDRLSRKYGNAM